MRQAFHSRARRARAALVAAAGLAAAATLAVPAYAQSADPLEADPFATEGVLPQSVDEEVFHSDNIRHVAHLPKQAPFDNTDSVGSDIGFRDDYAFFGNYNGFVVYDIADPEDPQIVSQVWCPGGQGDITVHGDLLFLSVDYPRTNNTCDSESTTAADPNGWEGIRVFDISDVTSPRYVADVRTDCGSHTHTLVPDKGGEVAYLYISSYAPSANFPQCQPPHNKISIVEVPLDDPAATALIAEPVLFPGDTGNPGPPAGQRRTTGCHDITVFPARDLAAGACMGDGILIDIADPVNPVVIERVRDDVNFAFWHSATFNNAGTKVVFTDELGGGGAATCNEEVGPTRGANGIYDVVDRGGEPKLEFRSYYKIPRHQEDTENCVAHNGSLIPTKHGDFMVQAWYQGGISVFDFTNSARPREIAYFDRGPLNPDRLQGGGSWSAYYYNGYIYSNGMQRGLDVVELDDPRTNTAKRVTFDEFNPQTQYVYDWPNGLVVPGN
ncbi:hypothetical protein C1701_16135 [Actinoalloteichus sp. AHMU CJ021]|uniref:LVIVD repeat-containing protein n=1 Tax=Actinoalloteichus caeruleus DSM 43889 TaxID=1120930 RepID=A0ABT1JNX7_ACTCY|nr:hypothetical protein [Actinoalloteichus caeruleus]AUS79626.1 hypothetical protein C1701_16135 [Actinoalloteichus sp. AHMU CJ021]MCP2333841.1 LVIVD repeat-containing protein [Actinoalloteichus caeruleus DSM 43889]